MSQHVPIIAVIVAVFMLGAFMVGCATSGPTCHGVTREQLSAEYLARVAALKASGRCKAYTRASDCPEYRELQAEQDTRAENWVRCP